MNKFDTVFSPRYFPPDSLKMYSPISCVNDINEAFDTAAVTKAHDPICNLLGYKNGEPVYKEDKPVKYVEW